MKLEVSRLNKDALITLDKLRVDVIGLFHIKVKPDAGSIAADCLVVDIHPSRMLFSRKDGANDQAPHPKQGGREFLGMVAGIASESAHYHFNDRICHTTMGHCVMCRTTGTNA